MVSGLRACGEDPTRIAWRPGEKDALDFLISQQLPGGGFKWLPGDMTENALATIDAVRPLGSWPFTADPPEREDGGPRLLPVPDVADGTPVPMTLVVDFGPGVPAGNPGPVRAGAIWITRVRARRAATGVRSWTLSLPYGGGRKQRLHVATTLRQAGAPDATTVRWRRPR